MFGSVFAAEYVRAGKSVLVLDKREHTGGFCDSYQDSETGIEVHRYGTHAFHTNDTETWEWLQRYTKFYPYRHRVLTRTADGQVFELPVNLATFERFLGRKLSPADVQPGMPPLGATFEQTAVARVGRPIYEALIKGYTRKHWGCDPRELPASIIARLPVRTSYQTGYFSDRYQGVPEEGYGVLFKRLLDGADVRLGVPVGPADLEYLRSQCQVLVWTGALDAFYGHDLGRLGWRSVELRTEVLNEDDHQGCAQMNYADPSVPWTRKHEPKHFRPDQWVSGKTVVQTEYAGDRIEDPAYPIRRAQDMVLFAQYQARAEKESRVIFGGRLANYVYYDMHQVVAQAVRTARSSLLA
jgi:UDP-galactopyranose mutase